MTTQKTMTAASNGAASLAAKTRDIEALRFMGKTTLNGSGDKFSIDGRNHEFYWVPVDDRYFWERAYGKATIDENGHTVVETRVGSHVPGISNAGSYMMPGFWYKFAPSTKGLYVSEHFSGSKVEIIQVPEEFENGSA